ncbi:MAG: peptide chain release factor N(5)-glutamine methyltransferase [Clostridiales bacterium]|nr:peptide chain release factor N(5)-glutamine methyltransferase [Clostridiales bacterium]
MEKKKYLNNQRKLTLKSTYRGLFNEIVLNFRNAVLDDCEFDAQCLLEFCTGKSRTFLILHSSDIVDEKTAIYLKELCKRRINGEPLQYILGEWEFMGLSFYVGKGVLIPRQETELLVETATERIKGMKSPVIFDLCAGTGCIGLTIANLFSDSTVYLLEKSDDAFLYLSRNKDKLDIKNAFLVKADIYEGFDSFSLPEPNIILSNPPYISAGEIPGLQKELKYEPYMALCGGEDGLDFYRCLIQKWIPHIKKGGFAAFECGENQAEYICNFASNIVQYCEIKKDLNRMNRVVCFHFQS